MRCFNCHNELEKNYKYCPKCGVKKHNILYYFMLSIINIILLLSSLGLIAMIISSFIIK